MELRAKGKASKAPAMDSENSNKENNYRNRKTPFKDNAQLAHKVNKKRKKREPLGLGGVAAKQKQNPLWTWTRQSRSLTKILTVPDNDNDVTKDSEQGDGEVVDAEDGEKKTEEVDREKKTEPEEVDREKKTEDVDREKKTEDVDRETKTEEVDREKKTEDVDRETKTEEVDRETKTEEVDRETKTEEVDREKKTEEVDREKKTEDVDREKKTEDVDREKKTEDVDRETKTEDVDREKKTEDVDREKKTEDVDREKKTEDVDREKKTEEVDRETETEDVDREKKTEDVDREKKTEEVDREKKTEDVDREKKTEDVDREKTGSETMNSDERGRNKNSEKEKTQKTQQTNANRKRIIVEPLELDDTSNRNHKQMPKLPKEKQDVGPKRPKQKRKQRGSKLVNRPRSESGSVNDDKGKKEGEVEVESEKEEQSEDVNVSKKKRRRGRSRREDRKFVTSPPNDDVAEDAARASEDDDNKGNERITDYFKKFRRWDPAEPENKLMPLPDQIPLNFLERKDHQKGWTNYYNNADHSGSFCMVLLTESLTHKEIRGFGNDVKKRAYYQILWEGGVVTGSEFASEEEVDACKQRQQVLELCAAKIQGPRQLPGRGSYTKIAKCTLLAVTESKWKKIRMEYRLATGALLYILNTVDNEVIDANFYYTPENMYSKDFHAIEAELPKVAAQGCGCGPGGDCASSRCSCVSRGLYYNEHGRIIQNKTAAVSECGPYCSCGDSCNQKTLQLSSQWYKSVKIPVRCHLELTRNHMEPINSACNH